MEFTAKYCFGFTSGMRPNVKAVTVKSSKLSKIKRAGQLKYFIFNRELSVGGKIDQNEPKCLLLTYSADAGRIKAEANYDSFSPFLKTLWSRLSKTFYGLKISIFFILQQSIDLA